MNKVAIIIVNWNGKRFLKDCLESIFNQSYKNFDVYFVDNGSIDGSIEFLQENFSKVKIIKLDKNTGFAYPNNLGIIEAFNDNEVEYILTINNDTKVDENFLANLVLSMELDSSIASVAPKIRFFYEENLIDSVGIIISRDGSGMNRGFKVLDNGQYDNREEVFGACAGASLYRRKALEDVSYENEYFDNSFFAYYEDLDLAWRLRLKGWKSVTCPEAIVYHIHSATAISHSPFKAYYVNRNRFFLMMKVLPTRFLIDAFVLTPWRYLKLLNSMFIRKSGPSYKLKKNSNLVKPFLVVFKGWLSFAWNIPALFRKRRWIQHNKKVTTEEIKSWFSKYGANQEDMIYK